MYQLMLHDLTLLTTLGVYDFERKQRQNVRVDITIDYYDPPYACYTDDINDAFCYQTLSEKLQKLCDDRHFHLIEHLAETLGNECCNLLKRRADVTLKVSKRPPLNQLAYSSFQVIKQCRQ